MNLSRLGNARRGSKKLYSLVEGCSLNLVDTSVIPSPEEMEAETPKSKVGQTGAVNHDEG
jgi:hypothetical protein